MARHVLILVGLAVLSLVVGVVLLPPDGFSQYYLFCATYPVALTAYLLGLYMVPVTSTAQHRHRKIITYIAAALIVLTIALAVAMLTSSDPMRWIVDQPGEE